MSCQILVRGFKLAANPPSRVAAHGVVDHQGSLDAITLGALERAEFVTRWAGRNAGQHRARPAVLTARALDGAKRRTGWQGMRAGNVERHPFLIRRGALQDIAEHRPLTWVIFSPWNLACWSILTTTHHFYYLGIAVPKENS